MRKKEEIRKTIARFLASIEIVKDTPRVKKMKKKYLKGCCCGNAELECILEELAASYTGEESPLSFGASHTQGKALGVYNGRQTFFRFKASETLNQAVDRCYKELRAPVIEQFKQEIAVWEISQSELFPEENVSIH